VDDASDHRVGGDEVGDPSSGIGGVEDFSLETPAEALEEPPGDTVHGGEDDGVGADEGSAAAIYIFCLARALSMKGVDIPEGSLPGDAKLKKLLDEVLK